GSPLHKSTQQVRTQGPIRHADCRQRKLADFLCTGGIIQGLISEAHQAVARFTPAPPQSQSPPVLPPCHP
ncbi:hypothetical protein FCZ26_07340, partial [Escherichia coli]|nr:hypothetical protein [Escherichia coli]